MKKHGEVAEWKAQSVDTLVKEMKENPVIGVLNFQGLPSKQLLKIKHSLRNDCIIRMTRKRLVKLALKEAGVEELRPYLKGEPALLMTKTDPFKIAKKLRDSRTTAAAKPGAIMPKDIIVPAGETTFAPGPIVGELGSMGVKAAIERGKVVIKVDSILAKEGEKIDKKKADLMSKLGIEPMDIGLDIKAAFENGMVYKEDVLGITTEQVVADMTDAASKCFKLTIGLGFPTKQNVTFLVQKSWNGAKALAKEINYLCKATAGDVLAKAEAGMGELKKLVKTEEKKEEPKAEEAPDEAPAEGEAPKEEPVEAPKEEAKSEEAPKEEPKAEEAPAEEPQNPPEEPKVEETKEKKE